MESQFDPNQTTMESQFDPIQATMESQVDQNREPEKVSEGQGVDTGEENEVSANSSKFAGVLQEEQPCCSSEIALKVVTVEEVVYWRIINESGGSDLIVRK